jgi:hypothetical protein
MSSSGKSKAIHARVGHQVIDFDGYRCEFEPIAFDYLKQTAGAKVVERWSSRIRALGEGEFSKMTREEKIDRRAGQSPWWALPVKNTLDMATSFIPRLMYELLEDMGLDFAVLYPTSVQPFAPYVGDDELR